MRKTKRAFLLASGSLLTAGCIGTVDDRNENESTNKSLNGTSNETSTNMTPSENSQSLTSVSDGVVPDNTPQDTSKFLFNELPEENKVIVAKTVNVHNGCAYPDGDATETNENNIQVTFKSVDDSSDEIICTTAIEPTPFAIELTFDTLQEEMLITATGVGNSNEVTYETTGGNTESILPE